MLHYFMIGIIILTLFSLYFFHFFLLISTLLPLFSLFSIFFLFSQSFVFCIFLQNKKHFDRIRCFPFIIFLFFVQINEYITQLSTILLENKNYLNQVRCLVCIYRLSLILLSWYYFYFWISDEIISIKKSFSFRSEKNDFYNLYKIFNGKIISIWKSICFHPWK